MWIKIWDEAVEVWPLACEPVCEQFVSSLWASLLYTNP